MARKVKIKHNISLALIGYCTILVFNLFSVVLASYNNKCATLYNSYSYQGSPFSLTDGSKQPNLRYMNFVPKSVKVTPGCFLTIFDVYGGQQTLDRDSNNLGVFSNRALDATCCECGGCNGAAKQLDSMCARLFENTRCDSCSGFRLTLKDGDQARNFGPLNNKMTSIAVRDGCTLTVFSDQNFTGWRFNYTYSNNMMGDNWYKQISSAICGCDHQVNPTATRAPITLPTVPTKAPITLPTVPTTWPPLTLPTVPTTRAPVTLPTIPTTRAPVTLPTVPTTRTPITLPTVPTTRTPITLPTVSTTQAPITLPTSPESTTWYGAAKSEELVPTTPSTTTTTTTESFWSEEYDGEEKEDEEEEEEEDDEWDW